MGSFRSALVEDEPKPKELMSVELDAMVSHSEESREQHGEVGSPPGSLSRCQYDRSESAESSSSTDSSSGVSSGSPSPPSSIPDEELPWDPRLNLSSALNRLFTFPIGLDQKLRLDVFALAAVGFFWHNDRLECFKCGVREPIIDWQELTRRQIELKHYDCTHPSQDDIPENLASTYYYYEAHRLFSFYLNKGWDCAFVKPAELAKNGFYYIGRSDVVKCFFCKLEISDWVAGDSPDSEHRKWNKSCPFILGQPVGNFEFGTEIPEKRNIPPRLEIHPFARAENDTRSCIRNDVIPRSLRAPEPYSYPDMKDEQTRLASFKNWPADLHQKPEDLAKAGFFYSDSGDECVCFDCGGGLSGWEPSDEPWVMHAKWFSECKFLRSKQEKSFIAAVHRVHTPILSAKEFKKALMRTDEELLKQRKKFEALSTNSQPVC